MREGAKTGRESEVLSMATSLSRSVSDADRCLIAEDSSPHVWRELGNGSRNHSELMNVAGSADLIAPAGGSEK